MIHFIKIVSFVPFTRNQKKKHKLNLKVVFTSTTFHVILHESFYSLHYVNNKDITHPFSLIKFFIACLKEGQHKQD
jgi:hypothetical protein